MRTFMPFAIIFLLLSSLGLSAQESKSAPTGFAITVNLNLEKIQMTRSEFKSADFGLHSYDKNNDVKLKLKEFKVKYPGQRPISVAGTRLTKEAASAADQLKKGDEIVVYDAVPESALTGPGHVTIVTITE
ncbi:MAG TPA: GldM family protein [Flavobacterium sp.]|jgi:hypothetical protein